MNRLTAMTMRTLALTLVAGLRGPAGIRFGTDAAKATGARTGTTGAASVAPEPMVPLTPMPAPRPMLMDLAALDQLRLLNLDDIRLAMPPISVDLSNLSARLAMMDLGQTVAIAAQAAAEARAAREASREAMEASRATMESMRLDQTYAYDYRVSGGGDYNAGKDLMNRRQYEQAIARFDEVIAQKGSNIDGALYWKAYAQYKLGKMDESLTTIATLRKDHAQSPYLNDAKVLEADARRMSGKPINPADVDDDELKILAINGTAAHGPGSSDSGGSRFMLNTTNSLRVKRQALYILAQSTQPERVSDSADLREGRRQSGPATRGDSLSRGEPQQPDDRGGSDEHLSDAPGHRREARDHRRAPLERQPAGLPAIVTDTTRAGRNSDVGSERPDRHSEPAGSLDAV